MNIIPMKPKAVLRPRAHDPAGRTSQVIAITSGKGGVGKTNVTSNLAVALAKQGNRVCIFDADTSLANINVIMGVTPLYTVEHLLSGERDIEEILLEGPQGVMIVPAASGIAELADLDAAGRARLIAALRTLEDSFDYLLIDTAAGIGDSVLSFVQSAQHTILVISTEPTSLTDAFALLRVLKRQAYERPAYVLVNMAVNYANSMEVYKRFEAAVRKYLGMKVHYLGYITDDKAIKISIGRQRPVLLHDPDALASRCFTTLAAVLSKQFTSQAAPHSFSAWWSGLADQGEAAAETEAPAPEAHVSEMGAHGLEARGRGVESSDAGTTDASVADLSTTRGFDSTTSEGGGIDQETVDTGAEASTAPSIEAGPGVHGHDILDAPDANADAHDDGAAGRNPAHDADARIPHTSGAPTPHTRSEEALAEPLPAAASPVAVAAPEITLQELAERIHATLSSPDTSAADFDRLLAPLLELYLGRFRRLPLPGAAELSRLLAQTDHAEEEFKDWTMALERHFEQRFGKPLREDEARRAAVQERQERLLKEYREVVGRLEAEQAQLHESLTRLYEHIDSELSGRRSASDVAAWIDRAADGGDAAMDGLPPVYRNEDPGPY